MAFERACAVTDVLEDEAFGVVLGNVEVAVARVANPDGEIEFFAIRDLCSHAHVALSEGEVVDDGAGGCQIECWLHGSHFDLRTGKPTSFPATEPVATFPVEVRGDDVYVDTTTTLNGVAIH